MALHFDPTDMDPICASLLKFKIQNRRPRCILMIGEVMMAMIFHFLLFVAGVGVVDGGSCSQDGQFLVTDRNWLCPNEERRPCDKKMHLFLKQHFLTRKPMPAVSRTAADEHGEWYVISFLERSTMPHLFLVAGTIVAGPFLNLSWWNWNQPSQTSQSQTRRCTLGLGTLGLYMAPEVPKLGTGQVRQIFFSTWCSSPKCTWGFKGCHRAKMDFDAPWVEDSDLLSHAFANWFSRSFL